MLLRTTLSVWIFLFSFYGAEVLAQAKASKKVSKPIAKPWAKLEGFRSAKFGMDQKKVLRAISKDFKISKGKVKLNFHPIEKTTNLSITVPKLLGGSASITYILGLKSKKLVQVNVNWGLGVDKIVDGQNVVNTANMLRDHFLKKRYKKDSLAVNAKLSDSQMVVFRGQDEKDRMVLLVLTKQAKEDKKISLKLSYMLNFESPDVFSIKEGEF
jgi:hypothetical protein